MKINMQSHPSSGDPVDALVVEVVNCGGVMSQIVNSMVAEQSAGRSAPGAPPIPVVLHGLLRSVLEPLVASESKAQTKQTTAMLAEITQTISEEIFLVPGWDDDDDDDAWDAELAS